MNGLRTLALETSTRPPRAAIGAQVFAQGRADIATDDDTAPQVTGADWTACLLRIREAQDQAAFAALFRHFAPRIKSYLIRCGGTPGQAEEATQEAMATVWRKAHLFDPSKASAATWIFRIARNKQLDAIRRQRRPEPEDLPWGETQSPDPAAEYGLAQEQERLRLAVDALPPKQREMVEKAFYGDLSHSEIAEVTRLPLGTIKSRIRLALQRLRHDLEPDAS